MGMTTTSMLSALGAGAIAVAMLTGLAEPAAARCPYVAHHRVAHETHTRTHNARVHNMYAGSSSDTRHAARAERRHSRRERRAQNDEQNEQHWGD
jgi:hypothetical protein